MRKLNKYYHKQIFIITLINSTIKLNGM